MEAWFLPSSQITGRMYNTDVTVQLVYDVKSVSQLDTVALLGTNYLFEMTETGFTK